VVFTQLRMTAGQFEGCRRRPGFTDAGARAEFETVLGLLDDTRQGQGRVLLVEGEPGMRESLLLAQACEEAVVGGFAWWRSASCCDGAARIISMYTVAFHLREVLRQARHQVARRPGRIALEHAWSEAAQTPRLGDVRGPAWRRG
jgi:hypothetical protein